MMPMSADMARAFTVRDFAAFGLGEIAYVRQVVVNEHPAYAIVGADGTVLTALQTREAAHGAIIQNDMEPLSVH